MPTTIGNVAINVADLARSERFYVDVLGLEVAHPHPHPGRRGADPRLVDRRVPARPRPAMPTVDPSSRVAGCGRSIVATDDSEGLFRRAVAAGAEPVAEPRHLERFKVTIAFVHDPDGHLVELGQQHLQTVIDPVETQRPGALKAPKPPSDEARAECTDPDDGDDLARSRHP